MHLTDGLSAVAVGIPVAVVVVPAHDGSGPMDTAVAAIVGTSVVGAIVVAWLASTGVFLRVAARVGSGHLVSGDRAELTSGSVAARRRSAVIATSSALAAALGAAWLAGAAGPSTPAHALALVATITTSMLVLLIGVPFPGSPAWSLLMALVDQRGTTIPQDRTWRAARLACLIALALGGLSVVATAVSGDPRYGVAGLALGLLVRQRSHAMVKRDDLATFLTSRSAAAVATGITGRVGPEERFDPERAHRPGRAAVSSVEDGGWIIGMIGPRQASLAGGAGGDRTGRDMMVPLADIPTVAAHTPAADVIPRLVPHGFVLVHGRDGPLVVESGDLDQQIQVWRLLARRRRVRNRRSAA